MGALWETYRDTYGGLSTERLPSRGRPAPSHAEFGTMGDFPGNGPWRLPEAPMCLGFRSSPRPRVESGENKPENEPRGAAGSR